ncbi:FAD-dependent oxidoreductase [Yinghuangia aomiensis]
MPAAELAGAFAANTERRREREGNDEASRTGLGRRRFLGAAGLTAAAAALPGTMLSSAHAAGATAPRVVVVGAGLAGLRCAHQLWTGPRRIAATVYEADTTHVGGRCWSLRDYFSDGMVSEHGGSFVSTEDVELLALAQRFGIETERHHGGGLDTGEYYAWVNNKKYLGYPADLAEFMPRISKDFAAMGWPRWNDSTPTARRLDRMSYLEYMDSIGLDPRSSIGQMMQTRQLESGGEAYEVSALELVGFYGSGGDGAPPRSAPRPPQTPPPTTKAASTSCTTSRAATTRSSPAWCANCRTARSSRATNSSPCAATATAATRSPSTTSAARSTSRPTTSCWRCRSARCASWT